MKSLPITVCLVFNIGCPLRPSRKTELASGSGRPKPYSTPLLRRNISQKVEHGHGKKVALRGDGNEAVENGLDGAARVQVCTLGKLARNLSFGTGAKSRLVT